MGALIFAHCGLICIRRSVILIMQWRRMLKMSEQAKKRHSHIELDFLPQKYANRSVERRRGREREGITKKQNCSFTSSVN